MMDTNDDRRPGCPYCGERFEREDGLRAHIVRSHGGAAAPSADGRVRFTVNGEAHELSVEPQWTLYYVLHDILGLTGAKQFCDRGACSSCTVIRDGRPVLSCMLLAIECDGANIETVEGVARAAHPLLGSYVKHHAMQCGYCTPGFIVTSKALLDANPRPDEKAVREALAGNLCRCGTYPQHPTAVLEAARILRNHKGAGEEGNEGI